MRHPPPLIYHHHHHHHHTTTTTIMHKQITSSLFRRSSPLLSRGTNCKPSSVLLRGAGASQPHLNTTTGYQPQPLYHHVQIQTRHSSHSPMGLPPTNPRKKVTLNTLQSMYKKGEKITMITAHDFPSAHVAEHAGMDIILVGDSLAMVALGMEDTSEVLVEEMLLHCRSVARATSRAFTVGDLPMGSYEISPQQALSTAIRFIKEGRVSAVKLEGGAEMAPTIRAITTAGIPVLAHIGLTPQRQNALGGFRVQGKSKESAKRLLRDALAVQEAGAFAMVVEAVPQEVAAFITSLLKVPTIGIGAGSGTSGQVLVQADMTGNFPPGRFLPKFVKKYGDVWGEALRAIEAYRDEVKGGSYPAEEHTYPMAKEEVEAFVGDVKRLMNANASAEAEGEGEKDA